MSSNFALCHLLICASAIVGGRRLGNMKVLFVHDHKFKRLGGDFYSSGSFPSAVWARYTEVFDQLTVVGRDGGELVCGEAGFTLSSAANVSFRLLPNVVNLKDFLLGNTEFEKSLRSLVDAHDALIVRCPSWMGPLFVKEAVRQRKPYAVEVVGCARDAFSNYGGLKGRIIAPYAVISMKRLLKRSKHVLYVTENFLQSRYPAREFATTTFCSNVEIPSVGYDILLNRLNKISSRVAGQSVTFGLIANYSSKYKGIDVAIRALHAADLPNWELRVLGRGDASFYRALAAKLGVQEKVHFDGGLPSGGAVFEWIDSIDIYLQPSLAEGLPRALVEVMSRGVPALATKVGGIPELLNEAELVRAGDYAGLAIKIVSLARDGALQCRLAEQNFNKAKNYQKDVLDNRRALFWRQFERYVIS